MSEQEEIKWLKKQKISEGGLWPDDPCNPGNVCPYCKREKPAGHRQDCAWVADSWVRASD